jgi:isopentenyl diphosphate isomerase/L-lactate dehydrogenase-like FMN-dependent dehydrogenase
MTQADYYKEHGNYEGIDMSAVTQPDRSVTWALVERIRASTKMKILIKGVMTAEDAAAAVRHGVDGIIVSNHGGRQENSLQGTIEALPEIAEIVNGRLPILIDGGIRRGTDVFKALALGASAVCIGRPYLWGLGAFGSAGVEKVLDLLQQEFIGIMKAAGVASARHLSPLHLRRITQ